MAHPAVGASVSSMPIIAAATPTWLPNVQYPAHTQVCLFQPATGRVDVYLCTRPHLSSAHNAPPSGAYWQYIAQR
ncbi:unnamed protein product [Peniophora sp. CBMAI 1063]|nr:unnamed protein product [Peniophora sp. CBMAI 1063]